MEKITRGIYYLMLSSRFKIGNGSWNCNTNDREAWVAMAKHVRYFCSDTGNIRLKVAKELIK